MSVPPVNRPHFDNMASEAAPRITAVSPAPRPRPMAASRIHAVTPAAEASDEAFVDAVLADLHTHNPADAEPVRTVLGNRPSDSLSQQARVAAYEWQTPARTSTRGRTATPLHTAGRPSAASEIGADQAPAARLFATPQPRQGRPSARASTTRRKRGHSSTRRGLRGSASMTDVGRRGAASTVDLDTSMAVADLDLASSLAPHAMATTQYSPSTRYMMRRKDQMLRRVEAQLKRQIGSGWLRRLDAQLSHAHAVRVLWHFRGACGAATNRGGATPTA